MKLKELSKKDLGCILYQHYINHYMEDDFSFDNGKTRQQMETHYKQLQEKYADKELSELTNQIQCYTPDGTDYESYEFRFKDIPDMFLQVTSMFDYDGNCCSEQYEGSSNWCDVGMFFVDYTDYDFEDLEEDEISEEYDFEI